jgi:hypothetical protein
MPVLTLKLLPLAVDFIVRTLEAIFRSAARTFDAEFYLLRHVCPFAR